MTDTPVYDLLVAELEIGIQAKQFMESELGLAVQSRHDAELKELRTKYEDLETPADELPKIRDRINVVKKAVAWLQQMIDQAGASAKQLDNYEAED